ncbi:MAG: hypothetical protein IKX00_01890 [Bacilli bacterium]|nr:hypothetical protein [Bacilli bacterium]
MENNMRNKINEALKIANEEHFESKHNLTDQKVIKRLNILKPKFEEQLKKEITNDEFINMLDWCMNFDKMQIWLLRNSFNHIETTEEENLAKFFELTTDERILVIYSCVTNSNEKNLEDVRASFQRRIKKDEQ